MDYFLIECFFLVISISSFIIPTVLIECIDKQRKTHFFKCINYIHLVIKVIKLLTFYVY